MSDSGLSNAPKQPLEACSSETGELKVPVSIEEGSEREDASLPLASTETQQKESSKAASEPPLPNVHEQKTVISKRSPVAAAAALPPRPASPLEMAVLLRGQRLGHFELGEFVGGGGMGAVFRAVDTMLDRTVAVKVLSRDQTDEDILRRFRNEAQSAARLDHPNIARVYYVGEQDGWNFIVFEFIEGQNVRELVSERGPLPLAEAVNYTLQVAEALEHAYRRDVVHRDIKPSNVLVMPDGHVKLVDMGLARLHQVESPSNDLTASGVTLGTFDYMSPEQARDPRSADVRSDLYSLGCTLYFMLTGQPPFPEGTVLQKLLSHTSDEPPDPRTVRRDLPEEVSAVVSRMLAKHPRDRYQTPSELIGVLMLLADQLGLEGATRGGTVWITPPDARTTFAERHLPWIVPTLALVLIILALDRYWPGEASPPVSFSPPVLLPADSAPETAAPSRPTTPADDSATRHPAAPERTTPETTVSKRDVRPAPIPNRPTGAVGGTTAGALPTATSGEPATERTNPVEDGIGPPSTDSVASLGPPRADSPSLNTPAGTAAGGMGMPGASTDGSGSPEMPAKPRILLVGAGEAPLSAEEKSIATLAEAIKFAAQNPSVEVVELRFSGERVERPFEIASAKLTLRAGTGFAPVVVFRPLGRELADEGRMVHVSGGDLYVENVHFRLELPEDPSEGWALFELDRAQSIDLRGCSFTIANAAPDGAVYQTAVAFFELRPPRMSEMSLETNKKEPVPEIPLSINLARCIARGQATLVRAERVRPFSLQWTQGLFASTERLVETSGAMNKPEWSGLVELDLAQVTLAAAKGLFLATSREDAPHQLALDVDCSDCIFLTDPAAPLLDFVGVASAAEAKEMLEFRGKGNFYPSSNLFWRLAPRGASESPVVYTLDQREERWSVEKRAQRAVMWKEFPPTNLPVHLQTKADYVLSDHPSNPAIRSAEGHGLAGFDAEQLPTIPENRKKPAVSAVEGEPLE